MVLNRRKVKLFTLEMAKSRAHKFTRVGSEFYDRCEVNLKQFIRDQSTGIRRWAKPSNKSLTNW